MGNTNERLNIFWSWVRDIINPPIQDEWNEICRLDAARKQAGLEKLPIGTGTGKYNEFYISEKDFLVWSDESSCKSPRNPISVTEDEAWVDLPFHNTVSINTETPTHDVFRFSKNSVSI